VDAESGAGGFIVPNDRVDVIVTQDTDYGETSQTILTNARVLAIGERLGEKGTTGKEDGEQRVFQKDTIATLELTSVQAETVVNAQKAGELSLVLRSVMDFADGPASDALGNDSTIQFIRAGQTVAARISVPQTEQIGTPTITSGGSKPLFSKVSTTNTTRQDAGGYADDGQTPPPLQ